MSKAVVAFCTILLLVTPAVIAANSAVPGNHPAAVPASLTSATDDTRLDLVAVLALRNTDQLAQLERDLQNRHSPRYHHWLTTDQFVAQFGPTIDQMNSVARWLTQQGFKITATNQRTRRISFTGSVATVAQALKTSIVTDGIRYANASDPSLPADLAPTVQAILGLSGSMNSQQAHSSSSRYKTRTALALADATIGDQTAFAPSDVYTFYNETPVLDAGNRGTGKPDCVALAEFGDTFMADLTTFNRRFNLPPLQFKKILVNGTNPGPASDNEPALDVEWVHAVSPNTPIYFYLADGDVSSTPYLDALTRAVDDNICGAISSSVEDSCPDVATIQAYSSEVEQGVVQGQTIFKSSGDYGDNWYCGNPVPQPGPFFNNYDQSGCTPKSTGLVTGNQPSVDEEAASPFETSVGGTQFDPTYLQSGADASLVSDNLEEAWNDNESPQTNNCPNKDATGGGRSVVFSKPDWQTGLNAPDDGWRDIPDVAMGAASKNPGFFIYGHGKTKNGKLLPRVTLEPTGGTSLATPLWAAVSRLIAMEQGVTRLGNINSRLYELGNLRSPSAGIHDVVKGNNDDSGITGYSAGDGYDQVTGWGSPNIAVLVNAFPGASLTVQEQKVKIARGATMLVNTFTVTNTITSGLELTSIALDLAAPNLFSTVQVSATSNSVTQNVTANPAKHNLMTLPSPLQILSADTAQVSVTLTAKNRPGSSSLTLPAGALVINDGQGGLIETTGLPTSVAKVKVK